MQHRSQVAILFLKPFRCHTFIQANPEASIHDLRVAGDYHLTRWEDSRHQRSEAAARLRQSCFSRPLLDHGPCSLHSHALWSGTEAALRTGRPTMMTMPSSSVYTSVIWMELRMLLALWSGTEATATLPSGSLTMMTTPSSIIYTGKVSGTRYNSAVIFNNHFSLNVSSYFLNLSGNVCQQTCHASSKNWLNQRQSLINFDFSWDERQSNGRPIFKSDIILTNMKTLDSGSEIMDP